MQKYFLNLCYFFLGFWIVSVVELLCFTKKTKNKNKIKTKK